MKTILSTLAVAVAILATTSCSKTPMPVPDDSVSIGTHQAASAGSAARIRDTARFINRDEAAPPPVSAF